jgi:hypothetical protein
MDKRFELQYTDEIAVETGPALLIGASMFGLSGWSFANRCFDQFIPPQNPRPSEFSSAQISSRQLCLGSSKD